MAEREEIDRLIRRIVEECPRRCPAGPDERRAQEILAAELERRGVEVRFEPFRFNRSLYGTMALHFAVALVGTALLPRWPAAALGLHALAAVSYLLESTRRGHVLRRLARRRASANLVARIGDPEPARRVVLVAHADAAYTGWIFHPAVIRRTVGVAYPRPLAFLRRSLLLATGSVVALAGLDVAVLLGGPEPSILLAAGFLSIPSALTVLFNLQVVLRNETVPGANDNLTGCAALVALTDRLRDRLPSGSELVLVATGCEEAGTGGALALARDRSRTWDRATTLVLGLDTLSGGDVVVYQDGEILPWPIPRPVADLFDELDVTRFPIPAGATDAAPFLARGFVATTIGCVDPTIGAPRHYHRPSDRPENLDLDTVVRAIDLAESIVVRWLES